MYADGHISVTWGSGAARKCTGVFRENHYTLFRAYTYTAFRSLKEFALIKGVSALTMKYYMEKGDPL